VRSELVLVRTDVIPDVGGDPSDRRVHPRLTLSELEWLKTVRLKYGPVVSLIDLSTGGLQIETSRQLQPGGVVVVQIAGLDGEMTVPSNVLRCHVSQVAPFTRYRSALSFKRAIDTPRRTGSDRGSDGVANLAGEHARMTGAFRKLSHARAGAVPMSPAGERILAATLALMQAPAGRRAEVRFRQTLTQVFRDITRGIITGAQPEAMLAQLAERLRRCVPTKFIRLVHGPSPIGPHGPDTIYFDATIDGSVTARLVVEFPHNCQLEEWHLHFLKIAAQLVALVSEVGRLRTMQPVAEPTTAAEPAGEPSVARTSSAIVSPPGTPATPTDSIVDVGAAWTRVVVRYRDGRVLKGHTRGFLPTRGHIQVWPAPEAPQSAALNVVLRHLKAVFFVHDFAGAPVNVEPTPTARGRNIVVTFTDGEVLTGTTLNYTMDGLGFFLSPHEQHGNNVRIFAVTEAVQHVQFP
jgi:hypothetical protein